MYSIGPNTTALRLCTQPNDTGVFSFSPVGPGVEEGGGKSRASGSWILRHWESNRVQWLTTGVPKNDWFVWFEWSMLVLQRVSRGRRVTMTFLNTMIQSTWIQNQVTVQGHPASQLVAPFPRRAPWNFRSRWKKKLRKQVKKTEFIFQGHLPDFPVFEVSDPC